MHKVSVVTMLAILIIMTGNGLWSSVHRGATTSILLGVGLVAALIAVAVGLSGSRVTRLSRKGERVTDKSSEAFSE